MREEREGERGREREREGERGRSLPRSPPLPPPPPYVRAARRQAAGDWPQGAARQGRARVRSLPGRHGHAGQPNGALEEGAGAGAPEHAFRQRLPVGGAWRLVVMARDGTVNFGSRSPE
eukprot:3771169-Prymnesium_polylepis.2